MPAKTEHVKKRDSSVIPFILVGVTVAAWTQKRLQILRFTGDPEVSQHVQKERQQRLSALSQQPPLRQQKNLPLPQILPQSKSPRNRPHRRRQVPPRKILQTHRQGTSHHSPLQNNKQQA